MRDPSGDQIGSLSGPFWVISLRIVPSATVTIEISVDPLLPGLGVSLWSNAIDFPSGDQAKLPTVNAFWVNARLVFDARSRTKSWVMRCSRSMIWNSPYFFSRSFVAADFGSVAVKAIDLPSGDH